MVCGVRSLDRTNGGAQYRMICRAERHSFCILSAMIASSARPARVCFDAPTDRGIMIKAVIFDHDGTLVDSEPVHYRMWCDALAEHGVGLARRFYTEQMSGKPTVDSARLLVETHALKVTAKTLHDSKTARLGHCLKTQPFALFAETLPLLEWLRARAIPMAIASGAARHEVDSSLEAHNLKHYFKIVSTREDVEHNKPAPDVYLRSAAGLALAPEACLAIEDSDSGQLAATRAGMTCLRLDTFSRLATDEQCFIISRLEDTQTWLIKHAR